MIVNFKGSFNDFLTFTSLLNKWEVPFTFEEVNGFMSINIYFDEKTINYKTIFGTEGNSVTIDFDKHGNFVAIGSWDDSI